MPPSSTQLLNFPPALLAYFPSNVQTGFLGQLFLYAILIFWALYTFIIVYHWFKYSHGSWLSIPTIILHLLVSAALIKFAFSGIIPAV